MTWLLAIEIIGTITGIVCVYLQTEEKIIAWPFGVLSVSLLAILFFNNNLLSDFVLHIILLILNIYGWYFWSKKNNSQKENLPLESPLEGKISIKTFHTNDWILWSLVIILITPIWGYLMNHFFKADMAYIDAFTTVGSLVAQYLLAKKILENWIIWIIVDVVAIGVYTYKGIYFVAFLFFVYLLLSIKGYLDWKKEMEKLRVENLT